MWVQVRQEGIGGSWGLIITRKDEFVIVGLEILSQSTNFVIHLIMVETYEPVSPSLSYGINPETQPIV